MTDTQTTTASADQPASQPAGDQEQPFTPRELAEFEADDSKAGRVIGKMLALLFIYTVIAMSIVSVWTANVAD